MQTKFMIGLFMLLSLILQSQRLFATVIKTIGYDGCKCAKNQTELYLDSGEWSGTWLKKGDKVEVLEQTDNRKRIDGKEYKLTRVKLSNGTGGWVVGLFEEDAPGQASENNNAIDAVVINSTKQHHVNPGIACQLGKMFLESAKRKDFNACLKFYQMGADIDYICRTIDPSDLTETTGGNILEMLLAFGGKPQEHKKLLSLLKFNKTGSLNEIPTSKYPDDYLRQSVLYGDLRMVKMLFDQGAKTNSPDTLLNCAAWVGNYDLCVYLISKMPALTANIVNPCLYYAAAGGHLDLVKLFLSKGGDINYSPKSGGDTLVIAAARNGNKELVQYLCDKGANLGGSGDTRGDAINLIWGAMEAGNTDLLEYIFNKSRIKLDSGYYSEKLAAAAGCGSWEEFKYLIMKGGDVQGDILWSIIAGGNGKILTFIQQKKYNAIKFTFHRLDFEDCVARGNLPLVKYLLTHGLDPAEINSMRNHRERTALMTACAQGFYDITELLLLNGADPDIADASGETAYSLALKAGNFDCALMTFNSAKLKEIRSEKDEAAAKAAAGRELDRVRYLSSMHCGIPDEMVIKAMQVRRPEIVAALVSAGANASSIDCSRLPIRSEEISANEFIMEILPKYPLINDLYGKNSIDYQKDFSEYKADSARKYHFSENLARVLNELMCIPNMIDLMDNRKSIKDVKPGKADAVTMRANKAKILDLFGHGLHNFWLECNSILEASLENGYVDLAKLLIAKGADITYRSDNLMEFAIILDEKDIIAQLVDHKCKLNIDQAFLTAVKANNEELTKYFVEKGANVNYSELIEECEDAEQISALSEARGNGNEALEEYLVKNGAKEIKPEQGE